jgi:hypothetical protein
VDHNTACLNSVGVEPVNFAFITKNGRARAPANPVDATAAIQLRLLHGEAVR